MKQSTIVITIAVIAFLIVGSITYIIKNPINTILQFAGDENFISIITQFKKETSYLSREYGFESVDDLEIIPGEISVVYFNQGDEPWKSHPYGSSGTIGSSGCGPTSLAICISSLSNEIIDPITVADWAVEKGYRVINHGSSRELIPAAASNWGLECENIGNNGQALLDALSSGKLVIALMGKGHFTNAGHYIVIRGVTEDGKLLVADCASRARTNQEWDIDIVLSEIKDTAVWALWSNEEKGISYTLTGYCSCKKCCGVYSNPDNPTTASGTRATAGRTIAADTSIYPFGTQIVINGHTYTVEDTGSGVTGYHFDIYFDSHEEALQFGKQTTTNVKRVKN